MGWMVGVGVEYAYTRSSSVEAEYNCMDFGTERIRVTNDALIPTQPNFDGRRRADNSSC